MTHLDDDALAPLVASATGIDGPVVAAILADQRRYLELVLRTDGVFFAGSVIFGKRGSDPLVDYLLAEEEPPVIWEIAEPPDEEPLFDLADLLDPEVDVVLADFHGVPRAVVPVEVGAGRRLDTTQTAFDVLTDLGHDSDDVAAVLNAYWSLVAADGRSLTIRWEKLATESDLEDWLLGNLEDLAEFGLDVEPWSHPESGRPGRQYRFANGLIADMICRTAEGDWLVIELKAVEADPGALDQVRRYMGLVEHELAAPGERISGLVVSDGATAEFLQALGQTEDDISHLNSGDIDTFTIAMSAR